MFFSSNNVKALSEMWVGENKLRRMYKRWPNCRQMTDQSDMSQRMIRVNAKRLGERGRIGRKGGTTTYNV